MTDKDTLDQATLDGARTSLLALENEIAKRVVGHERLVRGLLTCLMSGGHALLEGVPGLGKTLLVKTLGEALELDFSRIQFTPDLMPADIIGTQIVVLDDEGGRHFKFQHGPVFTQLLLADEINRATPKTQSALLEAMEEQRVTVGREVHKLEAPFMVLATQNPIEMEGTYPLPEAQLDRFLLKLDATFPDAAALAQIVERATGPSTPAVRTVMSAAELKRISRLVRQVSIAEHVRDYAIALVLATHPNNPAAPPSVRRFVRYGASPRGLLSMIFAAKCAAIFAARLNVSFDDLKQTAQACLQHRILLNFEGEADAVSVDSLIDDILNSTPVADVAA